MSVEKIEILEGAVRVEETVYRPRNDYIIVDDDPAIEQSAGGIWIPSRSQLQQDLRCGRLLAVGPGRPSKKTGKRVPLPPEMKPGEVVMYKRHSGARIRQLEGEDRWIRILDPTQVLGLLDEEQTQANAGEQPRKSSRLFW